ncbi:hypothetical protein WMY93_026146 [Mugilogobius chulae]|uniref:C-type lectin domain-containing protein n=1 Tax=Mugilogobius chulae TaxID=88201 RepID=A0AAW0N2C7_9GOBI
MTDIFVIGRERVRPVLALLYVSSLLLPNPAPDMGRSSAELQGALHRPGNLREPGGLDSLQRPAGLAGEAWIGLREDPTTWQHMGTEATSWRWSETGKHSQSGYSKWITLEPNNILGEHCVEMNWEGYWLDLGFSTDSTLYFYNPTYLSWSDAQAYCRQNFIDLVTVESQEVNAEVADQIPYGTLAWIGLYRIPFAWSDQNPSTFRNWAPLLPDNLAFIEFCGTENVLHIWNDLACTIKLPSICYKPDWKTRRTTVKYTVSCACDLSDQEILQQIHTQLTEMVSQDRTDVTTELNIEAVELKI